MNKIALVFVACFVLIIAGVLYGESQGILKETPKEEQTQAKTEESKEEAVRRLQEDTEVMPVQTTYTAGKDANSLLSELFVPVTDNTAANNELQTYLANQVSFDQSRVLLTADHLENRYISGKVETPFAIQYGSFTFRVNTMRGAGYFPAIWMLPTSEDILPEIDIYELVGNRPQEMYGVLHYIGPNGQTSNHFQHVFSEGAVPESYVLRFEWEPNKMTWYLEDQLIYTIAENVPNMPMYMIFNLAIGGNWPGDPTPETVFPATFSVEVLDFQPKEIFTR